MNPIKFPQSNVVYAENQPEYLSLPAHKTKTGISTSCWNPTFIEKLSILFFGEIYISQMTFNKPLQPIMVNTEFVNYED